MNGVRIKVKKTTSRNLIINLYTLSYIIEKDKVENRLKSRQLSALSEQITMFERQ